MTIVGGAATADHSPARPPSLAARFLGAAFLAVIATSRASGVLIGSAGGVLIGSAGGSGSP